MAGPQSMAFFHSDGLVSAWEQATRFAGKGGHIATLPEIIEARLLSDNHAVPWTKYFTTRSAEYLGLSKRGNPIIIVAHGVGPMSTLEGIKNAYSYQFKDKSRRHHGGRISKWNFHALENGTFGDVFIVDYKQYISRFRYAFIEPTTRYKTKFDKLTYARLGGEAIASSYLDRQYEVAKSEFIDRVYPGFKNVRQDLKDLKWEILTETYPQQVLIPYVIENGDASNMPYMAYELRSPPVYRSAPLGTVFGNKSLIGN